MTSVASLSGLAHGSIIPPNDGSDMAQAANVRSVHGCLSAEPIPLQPPLTGPRNFPPNLGL